MQKKRNAFTLIELLIVITIIGILASIVLVVLDGVRGKANDAKRIASIKQLQSVLELYYEDNGHYPSSVSCGSTYPNSHWCNSAETFDGSHWIKDAALATYIDAEPLDPSQTVANAWRQPGSYFYFSWGNPGSSYMFVFALENGDNHIIQNTDGITTCSGSSYHYGSGSDGVITLGVDARC